MPVAGRTVEIVIGINAAAGRVAIKWTPSVTVGADVHSTKVVYCGGVDAKVFVWGDRLIATDAYKGRVIVDKDSTRLDGVWRAGYRMARSEGGAVNIDLKPTGFEVMECVGSKVEFDRELSLDNLHIRILGFLNCIGTGIVLPLTGLEIRSELFFGELEL